MKKNLLAITMASVFGFGVSLAHAENAPELTPEAKEALAKTEKLVAEAKKKQALWIPAKKSLDDAKAAAEKGDSAAVTADSDVAAGLTAISMEQLSYPTTDHF